MMRTALCSLTLVLLAHAVPTPASQAVVEGPTQQETREARKVAAAFMSRIQTTRDIATLKDMFVTDFVRRRFEVAPIVQTDFGSTLFYRNVEADQSEWERLYAAQVNLKYFMVLYFIAHSQTFLTHEPVLRELCPSEVVAQLNANPFLAETSPDKKYKIETLEELRGVIATLEKAASLMREQLEKHPPEKTEIFRENLRAWLARRPVEAVYVQTSDWPGFPVGTRFFRLRTTPEFFDLTLVKTGAGMKIVWAIVYLYN